jgi:holliday junction DNA helicase RuvA
VMELKDKALGLSVGGLAMPAGALPKSGTAATVGNAHAEAISALTNLGYQPMQASQAVAVAMQELGDGADVAKLIRRGLRELAR